jgi:hypothetical protein
MKQLQRKLHAPIIDARLSSGYAMQAILFHASRLAMVQFGSKWSVIINRLNHWVRPMLLQRHSLMMRNKVIA